jgi:hypothetical protein
VTLLTGFKKTLSSLLKAIVFFICFYDIAIGSYDEKKNTIISVEILINLLLKGVVSDYKDFQLFRRK